MAGKMSSEVLAIQNLREQFPHMSQSRLAKRIVASRTGKTFGGMPPFNADENVVLAKNAGTRTFYSVYSVIRRYDAKRKLATAA